MIRTIVVGGGAAGAPLAAVLSEDPDRLVTVVEAGRADGTYPAELRDATTIQGAMPDHPANWSFPAYLTATRPFAIARGKILGGSSALNGASFVRPRPGDIAAWVSASGGEWTTSEIARTFAAIESDADYGDRDGHGSRGPMPIRRAPQKGAAIESFIAAAHEVGIGDDPDKNSPGTLGVGPVPSNVDGQTRVNTAMAWLDPVRARRNLTILGDMHVMKVRIDAGRVARR